MSTETKVTKFICIKFNLQECKLKSFSKVCHFLLFYFCQKSIKWKIYGKEINLAESRAVLRRSNFMQIIFINLDSVGIKLLEKCGLSFQKYQK